MEPVLVIFDLIFFSSVRSIAFASSFFPFSVNIKSLTWASGITLRTGIGDNRNPLYSLRHHPAAMRRSLALVRSSPRAGFIPSEGRNLRLYPSSISWCLTSHFPT